MKKEYPYLMNTDFIKIESCPYCGVNKKNNIGNLATKTFHYSGNLIKTDREIRVFRCEMCGTYFKSLIPSKKFLYSISSSESNGNWIYSNYNFLFEHALIKMLDLDLKNSSILDIGAYTGDFLATMECIFKTKSALDIVEFSSTRQIVNGEYLLGYLDDPSIFCKMQYDVITMFDVLEHCYDLKKSLLNCYKFLKPKGYLIIETGDASSITPTKFGVNNWWYFNLIVHHITIEKKCLCKILNELGFEITYSINRIHKSKAGANKIKTLFDKLKYYLFNFLKPLAYYNLVTISRRQKFPPSNPSEKDHVVIIARKL